MLIVLMLSLPLNVLGQNADEYFHSDFEKGKATGFVCTGSPKYSIVDKRFVFQGHNEQYRIATVQKKLNPDFFNISASIRQVSGDQTKGFGIVFASLGVGNSNVFLLSSSGYFSAGEFVNGKFKSFCSWTKCKSVNPFGKDNELRVRCVNGVTDFYINGVMVFSYNKIRCFGSNTGFFVKDDIEISAQYLEVHTFVERHKFLSPKKPVLETKSEYSEIAPKESDDGKCLYFSRVSHPQNCGDEDDCDIWYSTIDGQTYSKPRHLSSLINNEMINAIVKVDESNKTLYVEGSYTKDGKAVSSNGVSKFTKLSDTNFGKPKPVVISEYYNKNQHGTYTFSSDMRVMVMAVEREDTYGGLDLYISFLKQDGTYSAPKNLGKVLNTNLDDGTPYLSPDDKILYFNSYGHDGFGSSDIYLTHRLDDTWLNWSEPENLGPAINSVNWDAYFTIAADNEHAYFVSTNNGDFSEDIYKIELPLSLRPVVGNLVEGVVLNKNTKSPIAAKVQFSDGVKKICVTTNKSGKFSIQHNEGLKFTISVSCNGYWPVSLDYGADTKEPVQIEMIPLEPGATIVLQNVLFETAVSVPTPSSIPELEHLKDIMESNPKMKILVKGYAFPSGNPQKLMELSEIRAQKVKNYLMDHGISPSRISVKGYGGTHPLNSGLTEQDRRQSRRVEFTILSN